MDYNFIAVRGNRISVGNAVKDIMNQKKYVCENISLLANKLNKPFQSAVRASEEIDKLLNIFRAFTNIFNKYELYIKCDKLF